MTRAVELAVSYASGTLPVLEACLAALRRHVPSPDVAVVARVLAGDAAAFEEARPLAGDGVSVVLHDSTGARTSSGRHARMLDAALKEAVCDYFMTLDSDCFPVADGWLDGLLRMLDEGASVSGILWPWVPPPPTVRRNTIEWRLRRQHCWERTQVACQLARTDFLRGNGLRFADPDGDDNNFGLMDKVKAMGAKVSGLMPTRCALPDAKDFYPEFNRHVCVVYEDLMYHHGGASREAKREFHVDPGLFGTARKRVLDEKGAEFLLAPGNSHGYKMNAEEDVAQLKMRMAYRDAVRMLTEKDTSLFGGGWT